MLNKHLSRLINLFTSSSFIDRKAIIITLGYLFLATFIPTVKLSFVLGFLFFGLLVFCYSFPKAIAYSMIPLLYLSSGQTHSFIAVPAQAIHSLQYWEGRHLIFSLSPFFVILASALLFLPFFLLKSKKVFKLFFHEKIIFILFGMFVLSAIYNSQLLIFSLLSIVQEFLVVVWGFYLMILSNILSQNNWKKMLFTIALIMTLVLSQDALIALGQTVMRAPLGLVAERASVAPVFGLGVDENSGVFRPFGIHSHPNGLANDQILLAFSILILVTYLGNKGFFGKKIKNDFFVFVLAVSILTIILSLSRAAFLAVFAALLVFKFRHASKFKVFRTMKQVVDKFGIVLKLIILVAGSTLVFRLSDRLFNSIYSFSEFGGIATRTKQYLEAIEVFKTFPILGTGVGMFMTASYQLFPDGVMRYFPEPVHNNFLLFATERGIVATFLYLIFIIKSFQFIENSQFAKTTKTMIYSGVVSIFVMMLFHPQNNFFSFLVLIILSLMHYEKAKNN